MVKLLFAILSVVTFTCGGGKVMNCENVINNLDFVTEIRVINDGKESFYSNQNNRFNEIMNVFKETIKNAHEMPALGVSLDDLTKQELKKGQWLELIFEETICINDLPFDSLLIQIENDSYGFNLIRGNNGQYDGRCLYLNLNQSTNNLYKNINK